MRKYYVYILYSSSADRYYVGQSYDVARRLIDHNEGERKDQRKKYTYKHRPWELRLQFCVGEDRAMAIRAERNIKGKKDRTFIEKLIELNGDTEGIAQLVGVPVYRD